jgi:hypothetical protein
MADENDKVNAPKAGDDVTPDVNAVNGELIKQKVGAAIREGQLESQALFEYLPMSGSTSVGGFTPLSMFSETITALNKIKSDIGDFDEFLKDKLSYSSVTKIYQSFAAEQVDAIVQQIYAHEKDGSAIILADMAGMGKGRVCAGIARYAFVKGLIPVFVTEKASLFSDFYRDLNDIGGFPTLNNKISGNLPVPLILKAGSKENIFNEKNKRPKRNKPNEADIFEVRQKNVVGKIEKPILFTAEKQDILNRILSQKKIPSDRQIIVTTYSQFSGGSAELRRNYLLELADKFFFILDESHNASGNSATGKFFQEVSPIANGLMFSSATYAKRVDNLKLYALRNGMKKLGSIEYISEVLDKGQDRLNEYIASGLAEVGHLVRREKSFANSVIETKLVRKEEINAISNEYDNAVLGFVKIRELIKSKAYIDAKTELVNNLVQQAGIELAPNFNKQVHKTKAEYERKFRGQYTYACGIGEVGKNHFNFIEQLLFSIKAKSVAELAVEELQRTKPDEGFKEIAKSTDLGFKPDYKSGSTKPIIAVKNTLESIFKRVGIEKNVVVKTGDFSIYFDYLLVSVLKGKVSFNQVGGNDKKVFNDEKLSLTPELENEYNSVENYIKALVFNAPMSPIDVLIQEVESATEESKNNPFLAVGQNFRCREITGRATRFVKVQNGFMLIENDKVLKNSNAAFSKFNEGEIDFLIINQSGSTGASAHSSRTFKDIRPRTMLIHQVELNIQTEVQKRGRINRTGQVYFPRYTYVVSPIPSENRRFVMLMRKLKTLDALTTANRNQNAKLAAIEKFVEEEGKGVKVVDFVNKYGYEVAEPKFSEMVANNKIIVDESYQLMLETKKNPDEKIEILLRYMELQLCKVQTEFYNEVSEAYSIKVERMIQDGSWDLDTEYRDFKSVVSRRYMMLAPTGETIFEQGVFVEDNFIVADDKRLKKPEVDELIIKGLNKGQLTPKEKKDLVIAEIEKSKENFIKAQTQIFWERYQTRLDALQGDERAELLNQLQEDLATLILTWEFRFDSWITYITNRLIIGGNYYVPDVVGDRIRANMGNQAMNNISSSNAKLVDISLSKLPEGRNYLNGSEIEFTFAYLTGLTTKHTFSLADSQEMERLRNRVELIDKNRFARDFDALENWMMVKSERVNARFLSGNLFKAYSISENYVSHSNRNSRILNANRLDFVRFSIFNSSAIRYAIRLYGIMPSVPNLDRMPPPRFGTMEDDSFIQFLYDVNNRIDLVITEYDKSDLLLYFGNFDNARNRVIFSTSTGRGKIIDNPLTKDADWKDQTGIPSYEWDNRLVAITKDGAKKSSKFYVEVAELGRHSNRFTLEEFSNLCKYIGFKIPKLFMLESRADDVEKLAQDDPYNIVQEIQVLKEPTFPFIFRGRNLEPLSGLLIPIVKTENQGGGLWNIFLEKFPTIVELQTYNLIPSEITPDQVIQLILQGLNESQRIEFIKKLKQSIEGGNDDATIYKNAFVPYYFRFTNTDVIFGLRANNNQRGSILRQGLDEAEKYQIEKRDIQKFEVKLLDLNLRNAQKYLIRFEQMLNIT